MCEISEGYQVMLHIYLVPLISLSADLCVKASTLGDEVDLRSKLFSNYNRDLRPVFDRSASTVVDIEFNLQSIQDLDQKRQVLKTSAYLALHWTDELLRWKPADYGGLGDILVRPESIWVPDLILDNGANGFSSVGGDKFLVSVDYRGRLTWTPGDVHETQCAIDVTFYPFDTQTCFLKISAWMHSESKVRLAPSKSSINLTTYMESGEFILTQTSVYNTTIEFDDTPYSFLVVELALQRRCLFYLINTILPILLLSILNALVFIIPPEAGEKMSLSITVLLAYAVFLTIVNDDMPETSLSVSLLAVYIILVLAMGTGSIVMSAIVLHLHHKVPNTRDIVPCLERLTKTMSKPPVLVNSWDNAPTSPEEEQNRKLDSSDQAPTMPIATSAVRDGQNYKDLVNKIDMISFRVIFMLTSLGFLVVRLLLIVG